MKSRAGNAPVASLVDYFNIIELCFVRSGYVFFRRFQLFQVLAGTKDNSVTWWAVGLATVFGIDKIPFLLNVQSKSTKPPYLDTTPLA